MTPEVPAPLLVLITCPPAAADALAAALVEARLAACVNIVPGLRSVYRWQGAVERSDECLLIAKTTAARYAALEAGVKAHHPCELPECLAVDIAAGLPAYLRWLEEAVQ
ncbi:MAG: divalent-cation tolerance protein CutA [Nevskia sp.]